MPLWRFETPTLAKRHRPSAKITPPSVPSSLDFDPKPAVIDLGNTAAVRDATLRIDYRLESTDEATKNHLPSDHATFSVDQLGFSAQPLPTCCSCGNMVVIFHSRPPSSNISRIGHAE